MLAYNQKNMTEDEREHLLSTVGQAHAGLSEVALKLRWGLPPKTPVLKTAIKAERWRCAGRPWPSISSVRFSGSR